MLILLILSIISVIVSVSWYWYYGGHEPLIAVLGTLIATVTLFRNFLKGMVKKRRNTGPPLIIRKLAGGTIYDTRDNSVALEKMQLIRNFSRKPKTKESIRIQEKLNISAERFLEALCVLDAPGKIPAGLVRREASLLSHQILAAVELLVDHRLVES